jgi:hypothetical protein
MTLCAQVCFFVDRWFFNADFFPSSMIVSNRSLWSCVSGSRLQTVSPATGEGKYQLAKSIRRSEFP